MTIEVQEKTIVKRALLVAQQSYCENNADKMVLPYFGVVVFEPSIQQYIFHPRAELKALMDKADKTNISIAEQRLLDRAAKMMLNLLDID